MSCCDHAANTPYRQWPTEDVVIKSFSCERITEINFYGGEERGKKEKRNKREAFIIISNRTPVKDFNSLLPKNLQMQIDSISN